MVNVFNALMYINNALAKKICEIGNTFKKRDQNW